MRWLSKKSGFLKRSSDQLACLSNIRSGGAGQEIGYFMSTGYEDEEFSFILVTRRTSSMLYFFDEAANQIEIVCGKNELDTNY